MDQSLVFLFVVVMLFVLLMLSICVPLSYMAKEWAREIEERNGNPPTVARSSTRVPITTSDVVPKITPSGVIPAPINRIPAA